MMVVCNTWSNSSNNRNRFCFSNACVLVVRGKKSVLTFKQIRSSIPQGGGLSEDAGLLSYPPIRYEDLRLGGLFQGKLPLGFARKRCTSLATSLHACNTKHLYVDYDNLFVHDAIHWWYPAYTDSRQRNTATKSSWTIDSLSIESLSMGGLFVPLYSGSQVIPVFPHHQISIHLHAMWQIWHGVVCL